MSHTGAFGCGCTTCRCGLRRISSIDTNATADNLPGPGRLLGVLYAYFGGKLERRIGAFADRLGYGPQATAKAITQIRLHGQRTIFDMYRADMSARPDGALSKAKLNRLQKKCKALFRYSESDTDSTAIAANDLICDISVYDPYVRGLLRTYMESKSQESFVPPGWRDQYVYEDSDPILASSRKALVFVNEVELHKILSELYVAISPDGIIFLWDSEWDDFRESRLERLESLFFEDIALLVLGGRHAVHILQHDVQSISKGMSSDCVLEYYLVPLSLLSFCFAYLLFGPLSDLSHYLSEQAMQQIMKDEFIDSVPLELEIRLSLAVSLTEKLRKPFQRAFGPALRSQFNTLRSLEANLMLEVKHRERAAIVESLSHIMGLLSEYM